MQEWLNKHYQLIIDVCRSITVNYYDLAHDIIFKLPEDIQDTPEDEIKYRVWVIARNHFLDEKRRKKYSELTHDPKHTESEQEKDPYDYILRIKESNLSDLEKLWIETYLDCNGSFEDVARKIGICRQTVSRYVKQAINKLK